MKKLKTGLLVLLSAAFLFSGCASWNKTQKGAAVGTAAGGAAGAVIGRAYAGEICFFLIGLLNS